MKLTLLLTAMMLAGGIQAAQQAPDIPTERKPVTEMAEKPADQSESSSGPKRINPDGTPSWYELHTMRFYMKDGSSMLVYMHEDVTGTVEQGNLVFRGREQEVTIPVSDLKGMDSTNEVSAEVLPVESDRPVMIRTEKVVAFSNLPENSIVRVTSLNGQSVAAERVSGHWQLDTSALTPGMYVVTVNDHSIKVLVK